MKRIYPTQQQIKEKFYYKNGYLFHKKNNKRAGSPNNRAKPYHSIFMLGSYFCAHRVIWIYHHGNIPKGLFVDHINRKHDDNRIENLRLLNASENKRNSIKTWASSNCRGVSYIKSRAHRSAWLARISINKKTVILGYFKSKEEAVKARRAAEQKHFPDLYPKNYPDT
jgi:hypothetical protein